MEGELEMINGRKENIKRNLDRFTTIGNSELVNKISVGKNGIYVLKSTSAVSPHEVKFAVSLSNQKVQIYDVHGKLFEEYDHDGDVTDLKFSEDPYILLTSTINGYIKVWDSRCQGSIQSFKDDSDSMLKPILSFDVSDKNNLICAGTELYREDAFLLFWDRRTSELLGGYWDSHTDDISQICFNPKNDSIMASSGVDGLINVFDLKQTTESEALIHTFNAGSAVNNFHWKHLQDAKMFYSESSSSLNNYITCTTSMEKYFEWEIGEGRHSVEASIFGLTAAVDVAADFMIDTVTIGSSKEKKSYLATGTHDGKVLLWHTNERLIEPKGFFLDGHDEQVRTICFNEKSKVFLTGGEDGCVCLWKFEMCALPQS